ncbi:PREDICTED: uncharacterized protein LOC101294028 [Fragaria vesca subsp. vesca]|uniref:uncharacterized protein LOC101294028 n=1 Tax=Fragaria vesca subsp. vesca TaxID=101020 RepID=UPI0002C33F68|nr:PREDICTED: uncharacterized protein LOC101294028 [Fragaria vesca subsp. vesca]
MALTDPTSQWLALSLVLDKLLEPIDIVRFGAVCKQWHTFAKTYFQTNPKRNHQKLLPLLIIPPPLESDDGNKTRRRIYSLSETKVYDNIHLKLPSYTKRCCGSCHGWLATVDDERLAITLHNPFQTAADPIRLPPLDFLDFQFTVLPHHKAKGLYGYYVAKVVLSADPILSPDDYVVAVLCGVYAKLAFIKKGQTSWTLVPAKDDDGDDLYMKDLVFHRGKLYTVGDGGLMMAVDYNDHSSNNNNKAVTEGRILVPDRFSQLVIILLSQQRESYSFSV